ncbi:MAG: hypothetical protein HC880_10330 [Bacteroidia bacterium]|nr:hypothetical protein [Bacteroidia bacterium]
MKKPNKESPKDSKKKKRKKNEPLYRLQELFKKPELSPEQIAQARQLIQKLPTSTLQGDYFEKLQYKVPYFNQRDSAHPGVGDSMCNMSSMAMGLALFGVSNPKPGMQYDDALEQIRQDEEMKPRDEWGQMQIADHFGFSYTGLREGYEQTYPTPEQSVEYNWYLKHVTPHLRKGNAVTISVIDKTDSDNGHIVHLLGVTPEGIYVHDPYGKIDFSAASYANAWDKNATKDDLTNPTATQKGKKVLWRYDSIKKSDKLKINWLRVTIKK